MTGHRAALSFLMATVALATPGCEGKRANPAPAPEAGPAAPAKTKAPAKAAAASDATLGRILDDAPLPIADMLGKPPADVEAHLGEPQGKGMMRESCVRHVPDRTWFSCKYAMQKYADKHGKFDRIGVEYEDGIAASMSWEPIPGDGPFDPKKAMRIVGLEIPGKPSEHRPAENVVVWSYFNSATRLRIAGREYRVEVSVVDDSWANAKVELILNDRLTEDQKSRVIEVKPQNAAAAEAKQAG